MELQSLDDFLSITIQQLEDILDKVYQKGLMRQKISAISQSAATSFGLSFCRDSFSLQRKLLLEQIKFIEAQIADVETKINHILEKMNSPITTIPCIANCTAALVLGEIGDIKCFAKPAKLVAYAGLDATVSQSGNCTNSHSKMSKRGSPYLRFALLYIMLFLLLYPVNLFLKRFMIKNVLRENTIVLLLVLVLINSVILFM